MVNTKAFYIIAIVVFYITLGLVLSEAGIGFTSASGFENGATPDLPDSGVQITLGFWDILIGIFTFALSTQYYVPLWITIVLWLPLLAMVVLIYELIRGV